MLSRVSDFQRKNNSDKSGGSDLNKEKEEENSSLESDDIDSEKVTKCRKRVLKLLSMKSETVLISLICSLIQERVSFISFPFILS